MNILNKIKNSYREFNRLKIDRLSMKNPNSLFSVLKQQKVLFIHIPKTAGISLIRSLYGENIELGGHRNYKYFQMNIVYDLVYEMPY